MFVLEAPQNSVLSGPLIPFRIPKNAVDIIRNVNISDTVLIFIDKTNSTRRVKHYDYKICKQTPPKDDQPRSSPENIGLFKESNKLIWESEDENIRSGGNNCQTNTLCVINPIYIYAHQGPQDNEEERIITNHIVNPW